MRSGLLVVAGCIAACAPALAAESFPIAGLAPDRRPEGAPVIREFVRPKNWEQQFFYGVSKPHPASLRWAADQGAWFTPFNHPGMTPPYDLRGWHRAKGKK